MAESEEQLRGSGRARAEGPAASRSEANPSRPELSAAYDRAEEAPVLARSAACSADQLDKAVSGAAPIAREILEFFYACGVPVLEGWGMTETTAVGTVNTLEHIRFGTVGRADAGRRAEDRARTARS